MGNLLYYIELNTGHIVLFLGSMWRKQKMQT